MRSLSFQPSPIGVLDNSNMSASKDSNHRECNQSYELTKFTLLYAAGLMEDDERFVNLTTNDFPPHYHNIVGLNSTFRGARPRI